MHFVGHSIVNGLGYLWMICRYPDKATRDRIFKEEYNSSYHKPGIIVMFSLLGLIFIYELLIEFL